MIAVIITLGKSNKMSPVYSKFWKFCSLWTLWSSSLQIFEILWWMFLVFPEYGDLFYVLYFLNFFTYKMSQGFTSGKWGDQRPCLIVHLLKTSCTALELEWVMLVVGSMRFMPWIIAFFAGNAFLSQAFGAVTLCFMSGTWFSSSMCVCVCVCACMCARTKKQHPPQYLNYFRGRTPGH